MESKSQDMYCYNSQRGASLESDESESRIGLLTEKGVIAYSSQSSSWITPRILSDFTIGLSDGLTVPFALTAGLSALGDGKIVVYAGLAELVAGAISMGVAGYLGAKGECDAEQNSAQGTKKLIATEPEEALAILRSKFESFALPEEILGSITTFYARQPSERLLQTLLQFEEHETESRVLRPWLTGTTIATAYLFGGLVPLIPYIYCSIGNAFNISVLITAIVLLVFGCVKGPLAGSNLGLRHNLRSGLEMLVLGGCAAVAALVCVRALSGSDAT